MRKYKILFGVPSIHHIGIATDEMFGLESIGFESKSIEYGSKPRYQGVIGRIAVMVANALRMIRRLYQFRPDILYLNSRLERRAGYRDALTTLLIRGLYWRRLAIVIKSHGSDLEVLSDGGTLFRILVIPWLKQSVSAWLFLSSEEVAIVSRKGTLGDRIFQCKNIVRQIAVEDGTLIRASYGIPADHRLFLFVGRMIESKGALDVIEAFLDEDKFSHSTLIMVGDGELMPVMRSRVQRASAEGRVIFTGWLGEEEVARITASSDILVFPTYFPEGFPMALFNAVGAGLAVVTTRTRAAADYLSESQNCLWVEPKSVVSIRSAMNRLVADKELSMSMSRQNKLKGQEFTQAVVALEMADVFQKIMYK